MPHAWATAPPPNASCAQAVPVAERMAQRDPGTRGPRWRSWPASTIWPPSSASAIPRRRCRCSSAPAPSSRRCPRRPAQRGTRGQFERFGQCAMAVILAKQGRRADALAALETGTALAAQEASERGRQPSTRAWAPGCAASRPPGRARARRRRGRGRGAPRGDGRRSALGPRPAALHDGALRRARRDAWAPCRAPARAALRRCCSEAAWPGAPGPGTRTPYPRRRQADARHGGRRLPDGAVKNGGAVVVFAARRAYRKRAPERREKRRTRSMKTNGKRSMAYGLVAVALTLGSSAAYAGHQQNGVQQNGHGGISSGGIQQNGGTAERRHSRTASSRTASSRTASSRTASSRTASAKRPGRAPGRGREAPGCRLVAILIATRPCSAPTRRPTP